MDIVYIFKDASGQWRWHRRNAQNNKIVSASGEGYINKSHVIDMATKLNPDAKIEMLGGDVSDADHIDDLQ